MHQWSAAEYAVKLCVSEVPVNCEAVKSSLSWLHVNLDALESKF